MIIHLCYDGFNRHIIIIHLLIANIAWCKYTFAFNNSLHFISIYNHKCQNITSTKGYPSYHIYAWISMITTMMTIWLLANIIWMFGCEYGRKMLGRNVHCVSYICSKWYCSLCVSIGCLKFIFMFVPTRRTNSTQTQIIVKKRIV